MTNCPECNGKLTTFRTSHEILTSNPSKVWVRQYCMLCCYRDPPTVALYTEKGLLPVISDVMEPLFKKHSLGWTDPSPTEPDSPECVLLRQILAKLDQLTPQP